MLDLSRRALLGTTMLVPAALLVGCGVVTSTTTNGVTTITVNVAKIDAYAQAGGNFVDAVLAEPLIATFLAPYVAAISAAKAILLTDAAAFDKSADGSLTIAFDSTSVPLAINSVLTDLKTILGDVIKALPSTAIIGTIAANVSALSSLVSLFEAMIGVTPVGAALGAAPKMPEDAALATLGVPAP